MLQVEDDLVQMLAGALHMLSAANCSLVGGHTSEGAEAALGFSVTGVVHPSQTLNKGPLPRDSAVILTKPLGRIFIYIYAAFFALLIYCILLLLSRLLL